MSVKLLSGFAMRIMVAKGKASLRRMEKASHNPEAENLQLLKKIIKKNKNTEYGRLHNFGDIKSPDDFRKNVPVSGYEDYAPYIERIKNGEKNVLVSSKILGFSRTSGSSGVPKYIPATAASLKAYVRYTWTRALALGAERIEKQGGKYKPGKGIFLSPATNECLPNGMICSNIAEIGARQYGRFYPYILTVPGRNLFDVHDGDYTYNVYRFALQDENASFIFSVFFSINVSQVAYLKNNWRMIVDDIDKGTIDKSVAIKPELRGYLQKRIKPMHERAAYLREQFEKGFDETVFKRIWPNMTVVSGIGNASFRPSADYIRSLSQGIPLDFSIYGASEALVAACYELENTDMQLLTDSCYYEFIRYGDESGTVLGIGDLAEGEKYEILITNQAGLYRYRLKDVLEVRGFRNKCPLISFVFRKGQMFNIAGEKFSEEDARNTFEMIEKAHGLNIESWLFYQDDGVLPNRYVLLYEDENGFDLGDYIDEIEDYMGQCNKRYPSQREKGFIGRLAVQKQLTGTHKQWAERCVSLGASAAQIKPVHSLDNIEKKEFFLSRIQQNNREAEL
ncbi:MAG: GH3 auxin-responsive promoter family protein [Clostridia bacterium]|nr:GH3 auxin-responsive promoter family protein [Clostridia bacterium]